MSHTSEFKDVQIKNIAALKSACARLTNAGISCELIKDAVPRAYFRDQKGLEKAEWVIKLTGCKYDIGLYRSAQGGSYEMRADLWDGHIRKYVGLSIADEKKFSSSNPTQTQLVAGKLLQAYSVEVVKQALVSRGRNFTESTIDGKVTLKVA